jgi:cation transport ATPase
MSYEMKQRHSPISAKVPVASIWQRLIAVLLLTLACVHVAYAQSTGSLDSFISPLKNGLNLIMVFGFIAGCVMVMSGFLNAKRDENWKMTVIYGIGVAGAVALMKALFAMFGGAANSAVTGF